jgi:hypothetical protein
VFEKIDDSDGKTYELYLFKHGDKQPTYTMKLGDDKPLALQAMEISDRDPAEPVNYSSPGLAARSPTEGRKDLSKDVQILAVVRKKEKDDIKNILQVIRMKERKIKNLMYLGDPGKWSSQQESHRPSSRSDNSIHTSTFC